MERQRNVQRSSAFGFEQAPMVVVVVVAEKKELLIEISMPLEVAFPQRPWAAVHRLAAIRASLEMADALGSVDGPPAQPDELRRPLEQPALKPGSSKRHEGVAAS